MGKLLSEYKKSQYDNLVLSISSNNDQYYGFASNPIPQGNGIYTNLTGDAYTTQFVSDWNLIFGKRISNNDVYPIINLNTWISNTVYNRYDNTQDLSNSVFYVVTPPLTAGGFYNIFKCIDNNNNSPSTSIPNQVQGTSFTIPADGYTWRYITSISENDYYTYGTKTYIPVYPNNSIVSAASNNAGIDVVALVSGGNGYNSYTSGIITSGNSTVIQLASNSSINNDFYTKNGIFLYNTFTSNPGVFTITKYVSNSSGNWAYLDNPANTSLLYPTLTNYIISPRVVFNTDGTTDPIAYSTINTVSNSIASIVMLETGSNITWANVTIQSNTYFGSGANVYAIAPPPGGHGFDPASELNMQGIVINFIFNNNESNTILTDMTYNKIGLIKNPYACYANGAKSTSRYSNTTFSAVVELSYTIGNQLPVGRQVQGQTSGARGTVFFSNSSVAYLVGDINFVNETVSTDDGQYSIQAIVNTNGNIYTKDIRPLYVQNLYDVARSNVQSESYKLIIQV